MTRIITIITFLLTTFACVVEDRRVPPPPAAGCSLPGLFCEDTCGEVCEEDSTSEVPPEREPFVPDGEPGLEAEIDPFAVAYYPMVVPDAHLKCCTGSVYCVEETGAWPGTCVGSKVLTACYGCDFTNPGDLCSTNFDSAGYWQTMGLGETFCNGFSWVFATGVMTTDRCSIDNCVAHDGTLCDLDEGEYSPNGCPDFTAAATTGFDGAIGRMCCRTNASSPSGYNCVPRGTGEACNDSPHTISSYCMPCEDAPSFYDPDGSGSNNTNGAWDLVGVTAGSEPQGSVYCGNGSDDTFYDASYGGECKKVEYYCRGVQVNAGTGEIQNSEC